MSFKRIRALDGDTIEIMITPRGVGIICDDGEDESCVELDTVCLDKLIEALQKVRKELP